MYFRRLAAAAAAAAVYAVIAAASIGVVSGATIDDGQAIAPSPAPNPPVPVLRVLLLGDSITNGITRDSTTSRCDDNCQQFGGYRPMLWANLTAESSLKEYEFHSVGFISNGPDTLSERRHEGHNGYEANTYMKDCGLKTESDCIDRVINRYKPDIIFIMLGTNSPGMPPAVAVRHYKQLILRIAKMQTAAIFVGTVVPRQPDGDWIVAYNDLVRGLFYPDGTLIAPPPAPTNPSGWLFPEPATRTIGTATWEYRPPLAAGEVAPPPPPSPDALVTPHLPVIRLVDINALSGVTMDDLPDGVHPNAAGYQKMGRVWLDALWTYLHATQAAPIETPADVVVEAPASARGARPSERHAASADDDFQDFGEWPVVALLTCSIAAFLTGLGLIVYTLLYGERDTSSQLLPGGA